MFRLFRIGKLIRPLRVLGQFRPAWLLVRGMLRCIFTVLTTFLLIFLFLFIYGCLVLELIAKDPLRDTDPSYDSKIAMYFPDLYTTLVSLSQFVTLDNAAAVYYPMIRRYPPLAVCRELCGRNFDGFCQVLKKSRQHFHNILIDLDII